jgi:large subunit ribosomal protein L21
MSYAVIRSGGKQFRVEKGTTLRLPLLNKKVGDSIELDVLVAAGDGRTKLGAPVLDSAKVTATVIDHGRGPKIIVFKKKRRKHYKRTRGHRQGYTTVKIEAIG